MLLMQLLLPAMYLMLWLLLLLTEFVTLLYVVVEPAVGSLADDGDNMAANPFDLLLIFYFVPGSME